MMYQLGHPRSPITLDYQVYLVFQSCIQCFRTAAKVAQHSQSEGHVVVRASRPDGVGSIRQTFAPTAVIHPMSSKEFCNAVTCHGNDLTGVNNVSGKIMHLRKVQVFLSGSAR